MTPLRPVDWARKIDKLSWCLFLSFKISQNFEWWACPKSNFGRRNTFATSTLNLICCLKIRFSHIYNKCTKPREWTRCKGYPMALLAREVARMSPQIFQIFRVFYPFVVTGHIKTAGLVFGFMKRIYAFSLESVFLTLNLDYVRPVQLCYFCLILGGGGEMRRTLGTDVG